MRMCDPNLEQVEDLLAQVQLKVCVVGACHVVNEHQAVPLGLKAAGKKTETCLCLRYVHIIQVR